MASFLFENKLFLRQLVIFSRVEVKIHREVLIKICGFVCSNLKKGRINEASWLGKYQARKEPNRGRNQSRKKITYVLIPY